MQRAYKHVGMNLSQSGDVAVPAHTRSAELSSCDSADQSIQGPMAGVEQRKYGTANDPDWSEAVTPKSVLQRLLPMEGRAREAAMWAGADAGFRPPEDDYRLI